MAFCKHGAVEYCALCISGTPKAERITHAEKMELLRSFGDLQGEMADKARHYAANDQPDLALRFERASYAAVNARTFMQAALMAEREATARESVK